MFACAPTGSGKTLAFIVPILAHLKVPIINSLPCMVKVNVCIVTLACFMYEVKHLYVLTH